MDYENSDYRSAFWEGKGRDYEDAVERVALRRLLPRRGQRYIEFGAGFGRLINEAASFEQVVVMDYSRTLLQDAQTRLGRSQRLIYVAANLYQLPFADAAFDAAVMCRVLHHLADVPAALNQIRACLTPGATFILEFANKRNIKAMARWLLRRQTWNPFDHAPVEFVKLNFDFHPAYVQSALNTAGFETVRSVPVSWLRLGLAKRVLPLNVMVAIDRAMQSVGQIAPVSPSIFTESRVPGALTPVAPVSALFKCPTCGSAVQAAGDEMRCTSSGHRWAVRDGIYDFKEPLL
jgi:SAM-dependent methyltransferase